MEAPGIEPGSLSQPRCLVPVSQGVPCRPHEVCFVQRSQGNRTRTADPLWGHRSRLSAATTPLHEVFSRPTPLAGRSTPTRRCQGARRRSSRSGNYAGARRPVNAGPGACVALTATVGPHPTCLGGAANQVLAQRTLAPAPPAETRRAPRSSVLPSPPLSRGGVSGLEQPTPSGHVCQALGCAYRTGFCP